MVRHQCGDRRLPRVGHQHRKGAPDGWPSVLAVLAAALIVIAARARDAVFQPYEYLPVTPANVQLLK